MLLSPEVPTGIYVDNGTLLDVTATGDILPLGPRGPKSGTGGIKGGAGARRRLGKAPFACLLGRIGPDGKLFRIKAGEKLTAKATGHLYLLVNDENTKDNMRAWAVTFKLVHQ